MPRAKLNKFHRGQTDDFSCSIECLRYILEKELGVSRLHLDIAPEFMPDPETGIDNDIFERLLRQYLHVEVSSPGEIHQITTAIREKLRVIVNFQLSENRGDTVGGYYATELDPLNAEGHFAVIKGCHNGYFVIYDPLLGDNRRIKISDFKKRWYSTYTEHESWMAVVNGVKDSAKRL